MTQPIYDVSNTHQTLRQLFSTVYCWKCKKYCTDICKVGSGHLYRPAVCPR